MATKAETAHADEEKKGPSPKKARKLSRRKPKVHHEPLRAGEKAARASSNHGKPDSNLGRQAQRGEGERRAAKAPPTPKADRTTRVTRGVRGPR